MQPSHYSFIKEYPLTPVGKVDFKKAEKFKGEKLSGFSDVYKKV